MTAGGGVGVFGSSHRNSCDTKKTFPNAIQVNEVFRGACGLASGMQNVQTAIYINKCILSILRGAGGGEGRGKLFVCIIGGCLAQYNAKSKAMLKVHLVLFLICVFLFQHIYQRKLEENPLIYSYCT